ncbi:hypothetical protein F5Y11DRAFT_366246 [Daldinia sp. FL1419]|nr:hypothetical protein F5Y11DRAFT_366246 [Daldinia sp. FL1419]
MAATTGNSSETKIQVGEKEYSVDVKKIPYFESFLNFQQKAGQSTTSVPVHGEIPFFDTINYGVSKGYRHFFRRMPVQLSDYHKLCETLEFLTIDLLAGQKLNNIMDDMRECKGDFDMEERREIEGNKSLARDAAFRLVYMFLLGEFESEVRDRDMAYNATLFVVSHPRVFKHRTRKVVLEAFEERFLVSDKMRKGLNKWPVPDPSPEQLEADVTTQVESDYYYDSDDWMSY